MTGSSEVCPNSVKLAKRSGENSLPHIVKTVLCCPHDVPCRLYDLGLFLVQQLLLASDGADCAVRLLDRIPNYLSNLLPS